MTSRAPPSRPRPERRRHTRTCGPRPHAPLHHRSRRRASALHERRFVDVARLQRRGLQLHRAPRRAEGARPALPQRERHRGRAARVRAVGRGMRSSASTDSSRWRIWDRRREKLVLARDRLGVRPLYICEHAGRLTFASEIKAIFASDPSIPRALDPIGHRPDVHVLDRARAANGLRRDRGARAWARAQHHAPRRARARVLDPAAIRARARRRTRARSRTRPRRYVRSSRGRPSFACSSPTCRSVPTSPAVSTARSSQRSRAAPPARASRRSPCASTIPSTTRLATSGSSRPSSAPSTTRSSSDAPTSRACSRTSSSMPSALSSARLPRRSSCCRGSCGTPASRSFSPAKAPTRSSPATTCSARRRSGASGLDTPARGCARACSSASTRISSRSPVAQAAMARGVLRARPRSRSAPRLRARDALAHDDRR